MRSTQFIVTSAEVSFYPWIPVDHHIVPFELSFAFYEAGNGSMTATINYTLDNLDPERTEISAKSFIIHNLASSTAFAFNKPCNAVRLRTFAVSGSSNLTLQLIQAGN